VRIHHHHHRYRHRRHPLRREILLRKHNRLERKRWESVAQQLNQIIINHFYQRVALLAFSIINNNSSNSSKVDVRELLTMVAT